MKNCYRPKENRMAKCNVASWIRSWDTKIKTGEGTRELGMVLGI